MQQYTNAFGMMLMLKAFMGMFTYAMTDTLPQVSNATFTHGPLLKHQDDLMTAALDKQLHDSWKVQRGAKYLATDLTVYWSRHDMFAGILKSVDGEILGAALYDIDHDPQLNLEILHIYSLASLSELRGVGTSMIMELRKLGTSEGVDALGLYSTYENIEFYQRQGFVRYYEKGDPADLLLYLTHTERTTHTSARAPKLPRVSYPSGTEFFHIADHDDLQPIMRQGLNPPVYMIMSRRAYEVLRETFKSSPKEQRKDRCVVLRITLPPDWVLYPDEAFYEEGEPVMYVCTYERIPPSMLTVEEELWA